MIDEERKLNALSNRQKIFHEPALRWFYVIRRNNQDRVGAELLGAPRNLHGFCQRLRTRCRYNGNALGNGFYCYLHQIASLIDRQAARFPGCSSYHDTMRTAFDLTIYQHAE